MDTKNVNQFNTTNNINLNTDSFLSIKNNELVRLNGSDPTISGVNTLSSNNIFGTNLSITNTAASTIDVVNLNTANLNCSNLPFIRSTGVLLSGQADKVETAHFAYNGGGPYNAQVEHYPIYNNVVYNTNTNIFELTNAETFNPITRVFIKTPGYYELKFQFYGYNLKNLNRLSIKLWRSTQSNNAFQLVRLVSKKRYENGDSDGDTIEATADLNVTVLGYYAFSIYSQDQNLFVDPNGVSTFNLNTFNMILTRLRSI